MANTGRAHAVAVTSGEAGMTVGVGGGIAIIEENDSPFDRVGV